ncbi:hypothetical protein BU17DRAFT_57553 [Hysterangium stoloniferum]|nr:hypothetical protein BU17DRAFT_57553 [Hysterangium stoloniferum]
MVQRVATTSRGPSSRSSTRSATPLEEFPTNPRLLQTLTDANTLRNQTYVATLERSIIRKPGPRPPSPTTKVRTTLEKSKEERSKERERRAERRRRRDQGSNVTDGTDLDDMDVPSSPTPSGLLDNGAINKHARAPGDDEDYVSPERSPKASKLDPTKMVKTVKWDRSLSRNLCQLEIDASAVKHDNTTREVNRKGCLARSLRLDPLGNIPEATAPLEDMEKPHVVVTRFVYDDDIEELPPRAAKKKKS